MQQSHYCPKHQSKFYKNERKDDLGNLKVWYSHKLLDGQGFCVEKAATQTDDITLRKKSEVGTPNYMLMCNAMNNAIALAANDKIPADQIGNYYRKILSELMKTT